MCDFCGAICRDPDNHKYLSRHIPEKHMPRKLWFQHIPDVDNDIGGTKGVESSTEQSVVEGIRCDCGDIFTGGFREINLRRHKRTSRKHQNSQKYKCFESDCEAHFSRIENRIAHFRAMHQQTKGTKPQAPPGTERVRLVANDVVAESAIEANDSSKPVLSIQTEPDVSSPPTSLPPYAGKLDGRYRAVDPESDSTTVGCPQNPALDELT